MKRLSRQMAAMGAPSKGDNVSLVRKAALTLTVPAQAASSNQEFWKPYIIGNYVYWASGTAGITVMHVSDDGELTFHAKVRLFDPSGTLTSVDARGITHIGDRLFVTAWKFTDIQQFDIVSASIANPTQINAVGHGIPDGQTVVIADNTTTTPSINGTHTITVVDADNFTIPVNVTAVGAGVGGTVARINVGYLAAYDISDPVNFSDADWISTIEGTPTIPGETPAWIQDPVTDGEFVYVCAQYDGLYVFDPDLPTCLNMVEHGAGLHTNADWPPTFWEASNITITPDKQHVIMSNHGTGGVAVSIINISNPAVPVLTKRVDQFIAPNGDPLRVRSVHAYGDYLYCSPNSDGIYLNSEYRGLQVLDISDPASIPTDGSTWIHERIPAVDQDNAYFHGLGGDPACVGIYRYGSFAFLSNGRNGIAVFNVKDPTNPIYLGILTDTMVDPTNIYHARPFYLNGNSYLIYGTGPESTDLHTVYLDQIVVK